MQETPELLSKYTELMEHDIKQYLENGDTEAVLPLFKTDWVRILLVRSIETDRPVVIDVEISPPSRSSSYHGTPIQHIDNTSKSTKHLLHKMMEHIQYILALETSGFSVDLVGDGCLMIAYNSFTDTPDAEIFRLLQPPSS